MAFQSNLHYFKNVFYHFIDEESLLSDFYLRFSDQENSFSSFDSWLKNLCEEKKYPEDSAISCIFSDILKNKRKNYYTLFNVTNKNMIPCFVRFIDSFDPELLKNLFDNILNENNKFSFFKAFVILNHSTKKITPEKIEALKSCFLSILHTHNQNDILNFFLCSSKNDIEANFILLDTIDKNYIRNFLIPNKNKFCIHDLKSHIDFLKEKDLFDPQQLCNSYKYSIEQNKSYYFGYSISELIGAVSLTDILHEDIGGKGTILHLMLDNKKEIPTSEIHFLKEWITNKQINLNLPDHNNNSFYLLLIERSKERKDILWWGLMCGAEPLYKNKAGESAFDLFMEYEKPLVLEYIKQRLQSALYRQEDTSPVIKKRL